LAAAGVAQRLGDTDRLVRAALTNIRRYNPVTGFDAERIAVLETALAAASGDSPERARLLATLAHEAAWSWDWQGRIRLTDDAVAMARRLDDPATLVAVFNLTHRSIGVPDTLHARLATTSEAVRLAAALGDPVAQNVAAYNRVVACMEAADVEQVDVHLATCVEVTARLGQPELLWLSGRLQAFRALLDGRLEEAEASARQAFAHGSRSGQPEAHSGHANQLGDIRHQQGRLSEIGDPRAFMAYDATSAADRASMAYLLYELGQLDRAGELFQIDAANDFADIAYNWMWLYAMLNEAHVCAGLRETATAAYLYQRLSPWHDHVPFPGTITRGAVAHYLGLLANVSGRHNAADHHFSEALNIHQRIRAPYWTARTQLEWARSLTARGASGDDDRARDLVAAAAVTARHYGFAALAHQAATGTAS
jgi:tetratricopeptide (TPR) repeat protein